MEPAVRRLVGDGMLRQRLGAQARQLAEQHFGQDAVLRRLELELAALVANRGVWRTRRGVPS